MDTALWSTIGPEGIIIDLSSFTGVIVNKSAQTVQIQGGVLNKQVIEALYVEGLCTCVCSFLFTILLLTKSQLSAGAIQSELYPKHLEVESAASPSSVALHQTISSQLSWSPPLAT